MVPTTLVASSSRNPYCITPSASRVNPPGVQVQVSHDFVHIGKSVALVLARLGLPAEALVRVRRGVPGVVNGTNAAAVPSQREEGRSDAGVLGGATISAVNPRNSGRRKRLGERWGPKVEGLPLSASAASAAIGGGVNSPTLRRRQSGTESSIPPAAAAATAATAPPSSTLSQSHAQASTRHSSSPQLFDPPAGAPREDQADRFDPAHPLPPLSEPLRDRDVLVLSCSRATMISFQGSLLSEGVRGLEVLGSTAAQLQSRAKTAATTKTSAAFVELVLSDCNHFVGRSPAGPECAVVASRYGCLVLAVRRTVTAAAAAAATAASAVDRNRQGTKGEQGYLVVEEHGGRTTFNENNASAATAVPAAADRCSFNRPFSPLDRRDMEGGVSNPLHVGVGEQQRTARSCATAAVVEQGTDPTGAVATATAVTAAATAAVTAAEVEAESRVRGVEADISRPLAPGDIVLVVADEGFSEAWKDAPEFDLVTWLGSVPKTVATYDYLSLLVFCGMLGWVLFSSVTMVSQPEGGGGGDCTHGDVQVATGKSGVFFFLWAVGSFVGCPGRTGSGLD